MVTPDDRRVVQLRPNPAPGPDDVIEPTAVVAPEAGSRPHPAVGDEDGEQRRAAIIPAPFQRGQRLQTAKDFAELNAYRARFHGIRALPVYAPGAVVYAARGGCRLGGRLATWLAVPEMAFLQSQAVAQGTAGHHAAMAAHNQGRKSRKARWQIAGACAACASVAGLAVDQWVPWELQYALATAAAGVLVHQGRPLNGPMIRRAILPPAYQVPTLEHLIRSAESDRHQQAFSTTSRNTVPSTG